MDFYNALISITRIFQPKKNPNFFKISKLVSISLTKNLLLLYPISNFSVWRNKFLFETLKHFIHHAFYIKKLTKML